MHCLPRQGVFLLACHPHSPPHLRPLCRPPPQTTRCPHQATRPRPRLSHWLPLRRPSASPCCFHRPRHPRSMSSSPHHHPLRRRHRPLTLPHPQTTSRLPWLNVSPLSRLRCRHSHRPTALSLLRTTVSRCLRTAPAPIPRRRWNRLLRPQLRGRRLPASPRRLAARRHLLPRSRHRLPKRVRRLLRPPLCLQANPLRLRLRRSTHPRPPALRLRCRRLLRSGPATEPRVLLRHPLLLFPSNKASRPRSCAASTLVA